MLFDDLRLPLLREPSEGGRPPHTLRASEVVRIVPEEPSQLLDEPPKKLSLAALVLPDVTDLVDERRLSREAVRPAGPFEPDDVVAGPRGSRSPEGQPTHLEGDLRQIDGRSEERRCSLQPLVDRTYAHTELEDTRTASCRHDVVPTRVEDRREPLTLSRRRALTSRPEHVLM